MQVRVVEPTPAPKEFQPVTIAITLETRGELASFRTRFYFANDTIAKWAKGKTDDDMVSLCRQCKTFTFTPLFQLLNEDCIKQGSW